METTELILLKLINAFPKVFIGQDMKLLHINDSEVRFDVGGASYVIWKATSSIFRSENSILYETKETSQLSELFKLNY